MFSRFRSSTNCDDAQSTKRLSGDFVDEDIEKDFSLRRKQRAIRGALGGNGLDVASQNAVQKRLCLGTLDPQHASFVPDLLWDG